MLNKTLRASLFCSATSLLAAVSFSAQASLSEFLANPNPTIGVDGAYAFVDFDDNFGSPIYEEDNGMVSPFVGINLWRWIGVEAGFHVLPNRDNDVRLGPGHFESSGNPATLINAGEFSDVWSVRSIDIPYLAMTVNYQLPKCKPISIFGALGAGWARLEAEEQLYNQDVGPIANLPNFNRTFNETRGVFMARVGGSLMVHDNIGVRVFGEYLNTSRLSVMSRELNALGQRAEVKLKDTYLLGAGVFITNVI